MYGWMDGWMILSKLAKFPTTRGTTAELFVNDKIIDKNSNSFPPTGQHQLYSEIQSDTIINDSTWHLGGGGTRPEESVEWCHL